MSASVPDVRLRELRVLVVHDWIIAWAGAERVLEQILELFPQADLVVGVMGRGTADLNAVTRRARETWLARLPFARTHHRWFLPLYPAAFASVDTRGYDLVISSAHAFAKSVRRQPEGLHLCYCHSPPRYLYDLQSTYQASSGLAGRILGWASPVLRRIDRASARGVDRFVANSRYIAERIRRSYDRGASLVYPPVEAKPRTGAGEPRGDELLVFGRLVPYKRVELAIEAANTLSLPLLVAGDGPERERLERMAGPTVVFLGEVSEEEAGALMERCRLMLFCAEEDFGIAPVEANIHGLPVVAFGRGGVVETMTSDTGEFFEEQTAESLAGAIERALRREWDGQKIRENGARFSASRFRRELASEVALLLDGGARPVVGRSVD